MAKSTRKPLLISEAPAYFEAGLNVLFIGEHGVGKTEVVRQVAEQLGIDVAYYSCATMDPYTDFVGIPHPVPLVQNGEVVRHADGRDKFDLEQVRPHRIDEAELIFLDELNRADDKVLNAVLELVQFRSINGEHLPKLKCVWAAINPPQDDYHVNELDPALVDRFDVYREIKAAPTVSYLQTKMSKPIAQALVQFWNDHQEEMKRHAASNKKDFKRMAFYISPRRLEKIGTTVERLGSAQGIKYLFPPGVHAETMKLQTMLIKALDPAQTDKTFSVKDLAANGPNDSITYTATWIVGNLDFVSEQMQDIDCTDETKNRVLDQCEQMTDDEWLKVMNKLAEDGAINNGQIDYAFAKLTNERQQEITAKTEYGTKLDVAIFDYEPDQTK